MALLKRAGRFIATINDLGISYTGKPEKCTAIIGYTIDQEYRAGAWVDVSAEDSTITGYFYLENNDGKLNEFTVKALRDSLAWDGRNIERLTQAKGCQVQITVEMETYNGTARAKVKFMNNGAWDGGAGGVKHDPAAVKSAQARLGAKLKALSGGAPVATTEPEPEPTDEPAPWDDPAASARPTMRPQQQATIYDGDTVWNIFTQRYQSLTGPAQTNAWHSFIRRVVPGCTDDNALTSQQWEAVAHEIETAQGAVV